VHKELDVKTHGQYLLMVYYAFTLCGVNIAVFLGKYHILQHIQEAF